MPPSIATVCYLVLIAALFWLDRNRTVRTSAALWVPVLWFWLACSRSLTQWLQMDSVASVDQVMEGSPLDRAVYMCLVIVGAIIVLWRRQQIAQILRSNGTIVLFFSYCLVSLLWSDYPDVAFKRWIKAIGDLIMVLIVLSDRHPLEAVERLFARVAYLLIPLSVLLIKYYPELGRGYGAWLGEVQYFGVTTNKNTLGVICLFLGLAALWRTLTLYRAKQTQHRFRKMIAQAVILVMVLWMLKIADSMTSLSCFLMGSILIVAANLRMVRRRPLFIHLLIATMLLASVSVVFLGASPETLKTMGRNPTLTDRTAVWKMVLGLSQNQWVGTGFESFWLGPRLEKMWTRYWWHPGEAHNGYLEIFINLGWVGIALLFVVVAAGYQTVFQAWRNHVATGSLCLAFFMVGLAYNFTEAAFFRMLAPAWLFFLLAIVRMPAMVPRKARVSTQNLLQAADPGCREPITAALNPAT